MGNLLFDFGQAQVAWHAALLSFLLAFLTSTAIAYTYEKTFSGFSYSKALLHAMTLGSLVSCLLMIAIGDNIARGIGIVGSLAIIRFRTNLRDPRDLVFLFASFGVGVASGVQSYFVAIVGCLVFCGAAILLSNSMFGSRRSHDGIVRFQAKADFEANDAINSALRSYTSRFTLIAMKEAAQGGMVDYSYQVKLVTPESNLKLVEALESVPSIRGISYINQQATIEL